VVYHPADGCPLKPSGVGAAETVESVSRGGDQEAREIGQSTKLHTGGHFRRNEYECQAIEWVGPQVFFQELSVIP